MRNSSKLQDLRIHVIIVGLKYSLNFLKGNFIPWTNILEVGVPLGHFSGSIFPPVVNFKWAFSWKWPIINYLSTIFFKKGIKIYICVLRYYGCPIASGKLLLIRFNSQVPLPTIVGHASMYDKH